MQRPYLIRGHEINSSTSIGISIFPDDSREVDTLHRYADIAMYYAKEKGRSNFKFYDPSIDTRSIERMRFENRLRQAIDRDELRLYYQPLVDLPSKRTTSSEVLLRWEHPERGLLEPDAFLASAEDMGLMAEIDKWVIKNVAREIKKWIAEGTSPVCVTVNLSAAQFENRGFVRRISAILDEAGLPPGCLTVEITETLAMRNIEGAISRLQELRGRGVTVSIDDFGTGYSSLNYLKRLPVQKLKIDKSFVQDIATDPGDRKIISAIVSMAHAMNLKVVAEGVENEDQLSFLQSLKCDEAQGFLFSKPLPAREFRELVAAAPR